MHAGSTYIVLKGLNGDTTATPGSSQHLFSQIELKTRRFFLRTGHASAVRHMVCGLGSFQCSTPIKESYFWYYLLGLPVLLLHLVD